MKRKTKTVEKRTYSMKGAIPRFVSLVSRGANFTPLSQLKYGETESFGQDVEINRIEFAKTKFETADQVATYLHDNAFEEFDVIDSGNTWTVAGTESDTFEDIQPVEYEDGVLYFVGKLKEGNVVAPAANIIISEEYFGPGATLNGAGHSFANSLISAGKVDKSDSWSFSSEDGNSLLGSNKDWSNYGKHFLGVDASAPKDSKGHYKYPFAKGDTLYRSALVAIRSRSAQQGAKDIFNVAGALLERIDGKKPNDSTKHSDEQMENELEEFATKQTKQTVNGEGMVAKDSPNSQIADDNEENAETKSEIEEENERDPDGDGDDDSTPDGDVDNDTVPTGKKAQMEDPEVEPGSPGHSQPQTATPKKLKKDKASTKASDENDPTFVPEMVDVNTQYEETESTDKESTGAESTEGFSTETQEEEKVTFTADEVAALLVEFKAKITNLEEKLAKFEDKPVDTIDENTIVIQNSQAVNSDEIVKEEDTKQKDEKAEKFSQARKNDLFGLRG